MKKEHTPTPLISGKSPFEVYNHDHGDAVPFYVTRGQVILAYCYEYDDAAHIVKCVNMHDELVEALKFLLSSAHDNQTGIQEAEETLKKAGAFAKARGEV